MAEIRLEGVTKRYGTVAALDAVSLTVEDGSFTSVFGPPGSGKSVLLRTLLGLEIPDQGQIIVGGKAVTQAAPNARNLSMVFQNLALFPHLTARENIVFPLARRGVGAGEIGTRLDRIAGVLSIAHILHKKPAALSGGERQRVAIGRALIRDAAAYLMDEPIAALDARLRDAMRVELKRLQSELGFTFIYVTHDCDEAMSVADRMAILESGKLVQVDAPDRIYSSPGSLYVAELVGSPRINVFEGVCVTEGVRCDLGVLPGAGAPGPVRIGLRPEALGLHVDVQGPGSGTVEDIERLGAFSIVTVLCGATRLRAIAGGDMEASVGARVGLTVDPAGMYLFDPASGTRIS